MKKLIKKLVLINKRMYTVDVTSALLVLHERITMPTQTALRVRGGKAGLQLAEKV